MNALEVRNFITEHVGRWGRRSRIVVEIEQPDESGVRIETREVEFMQSKSIDEYGDSHVVLKIGRLIKSKRKFD